MRDGKSELWFQITSGRGPVECAWAVVQVLKRLQEEAIAAGFDSRTVEITPGPEPGTALSAMVALSGGAGLDSFASAWRGTVQWIAPSPFRPEHKRKNWFVGIEVLAPVEETRFDSKDLRWETMRATGPGGQHVNRTESAVRITHLPTGTHASASEERSQHRNRKLALARLARKLTEMNARQRGEAKEKRWRAHDTLTRGNPTRSFREGQE